MNIKTGKGTIPLMVLLAIWSVSMLSSLPGLAVSPILGKISDIFPHATELDVQMLTSLPSLLIIPFVLLAGKLTEQGNYLKLLYAGLVVFTACALLYLVSDSLWQLEVISALLGVGAGLIIPLSTGLVSKYFTGEYRTAQFGYTSAVNNITLVLATVATGYLAEVQWRLPFMVYLLALVPLVLIGRLKRSPDGECSKKDEDATTAGRVRGGIQVRPLLSMMGYYLLITYLSVIVSFNLPFLMQEYGFDSGAPGILISVFFLAIMLPGFFLNYVVKLLGHSLPLVCLLMIAVGLLLIVLSHSAFLMGVGCFVSGFGYGVAQPVIYDRTSAIALPQKAVMALAWVMSMNYVAILLCPVVVDAAQALMQVQSQQFAFWFNFVIAMIAATVLLVQRVIKRKT